MNIGFSSSINVFKAGIQSVALTALICLPGCLSPIALDRAVIEYDKASNDILSKQLLLNIARSHQHLPLHFTGISNIAATFNFQFNAGATPALTGNSGSLITPIFGGTVSENPTISIVPIEGEEFTQRLLTPFQENKFIMLLRQGADVDLILRLIAGELRLDQGNEAGIYLNKPSYSKGYRFFRQAVLHISSIQDRNQLFVEPLIFDQQLLLPTDSLTSDQISNLQKEYSLVYLTERKQIQLRKKVIGRIVLTNYDPNILSNEDRIRLHNEANQRSDNDVMIDLRSNYPGGEWPMRGVFRLRSFHNVLNAIGQSIDGEREYHVGKHPLTPYVSENPVDTLGVTITQDKPNDTDLTVAFGDQYYTLKPESGYQWNREGFRLLSQIFQMTITDLNKQNVPAITIAK